MREESRERREGPEIPGVKGDRDNELNQQLTCKYSYSLV
jgi:hypothetical protein